MRTAGGSLQHKVFLSVFSHLIRKVFHRRVFLIAGLNLFPAAAQLQVNRTDNLRECLHKLLSQPDQDRSVSNQLLVPYFQRVHILRTEGQILQKTVSLLQDLIVRSQRRHIDFVKLAQFHVQKSAPS